MRRILRLLVVANFCTWVSAVEASNFALQLTLSAAPLETTAVYPLRPSQNQRYLVDQNNVPFFIAGDSPQNIILALSEAEADWFMTNRRAVGFNTLWINI